MSSTTDYNLVLVIAQQDVAALEAAGKSYGDSWKKRGGVGAFMMLARKWDRIELQVSRCGYDVFHAYKKDSRPEGLLDDIRDLRRYLLLVEEELLRQQSNALAFQSESSDCSVVGRMLDQ